MIAPLSWIKDYIDITLKPEELGERLTEVGLGTERIRRDHGDIIFDLEITPNRPDWLSMIGVAREIAAVEGQKISYPQFITDLKPKKGIQLFPLTIHPDFSCSERMTGIIISGIKVKESSKWLKEKLESIGQRPINNIVDITNFVMWELGNPIHAFDYDKISGHEMWVRKAKGGEKFESVDSLSYHLPKGAIIYEDKEKIFDLAGIKGGKNSGTYNETKNLFILVPVDNPILIRRASQALGLRSDASAIFERAVNKGGTVNALKRTVDLILEEAGGEVASELIDLKEQDFNPWKLSLRLDRLEFILGIKIPEREVISILDRLNLSPRVIPANATSDLAIKGIQEPGSLIKSGMTEKKGNIIVCTIPTYRNDLQIEEDLIEEVARLYGYNNFPKTLPEGQIPTKTIPYFRDFRNDERVKRYMAAVGFSEIYTYSLTSEKDLEENGINSEHVLRVDNPVSRDFEYLRPTLRINILKSLRQNLANYQEVDLFELGKVYIGKNLDKIDETYHLSGISNKKNFYEVKGILEALFTMLGIHANPADYMELLEEGVYFEIPYTHLLENAIVARKFIPLPKYPGVTEDIALVLEPGIKTGDIIQEVQKQSPLISKISLLDWYQNTRTFHIVYQNPERNLTTEEVAQIRAKILDSVYKKFAAKLK